MAMLGALGVKDNPSEELEREYAAGAWLVPGRLPRPAVAREPGVPDWWTDEDEASDSFLQAMGVRLG